MELRRFLVSSRVRGTTQRAAILASAVFATVACISQSCAGQSSADDSAGANSEASAPTDTRPDSVASETPDAEPSALNPATPDALDATTKPASPTGTGTPPTPVMIETWLESGVPRMVAWGAHGAGAMHDENAVPELTALAGRWQPLVPSERNDDGAPTLSKTQAETRDAMADVLDALVQMNATLPHSSLRDLAHDFPSETAIFLARMPASESADLRLGFFRDSSRDTPTLRYVAAALLAREPQPGFAAELMSGIRVRITIQVISPGTTMGGYGAAGDCASIIEEQRDNWPPTPHYRLSLDKGAGDGELVGGAEPVYMQRMTGGSYSDHSCGDGIYLSDQRRQNLLAEMLGVKPDAIAWEVDIHHPIAFRSQKQYEADVLAFLNGEIEKQRTTATALADKGLITPGDVRDALPEIIVDVSDERGADTPVAEVTNLPERVIYSKYYKWPEQ
jgi:hypothetical protein